MRNAFKCLLLAAVMVFAGIAAFAQVTTSSLGGRVVDQNGEPVIGAAVVAIHEPSGTTYGTVTNGDGLYTIQGMRTGGPYRVEVSCLGYQQVNYTEVTLQLAETYNLNPQISESNEFLSEAVVVASPTSKFAAVEKTGASTNISSRQIIEMPSISRSFSDMAKLSPYGGNGMNFSGSSGRSTNFTVDGANVNNNFGLSAALPGGGNPISIDAIEEMQVVVSPYDVRQSNFIGGGINAITKSGTNTFKGTAYVYYQNENMHGNRIDGVDLERTPESKTTYGFTLGGPIIKNKLFFFVNAEQTKIPSVVNRWKGSEDGVADVENFLSRTTLSDLERVSKHVMDKYGYNTGSYTAFPADESNTKFLVRLDWNINDKHKLAIRYNYTLNKVWNSPNATSMDGGTRASGSRMSQYSMSFANSMYSMDNYVKTFSVDLNSRLSDNLSNQFLATFSKLDDIRGSNSSEFPFIDILAPDETGNDNNYMALGYELFTWNNAVHNTVANVKDDLTFFFGSHKLMAGFNFEYQMADNQYMRNGTGYYRYKSVDDFINGATPEVVCLTYGYDGESKPAARVQSNKFGIYAQDDWQASDKLKLTYGLRIDGLFYNNDDLMTNQAIKDLKYFDNNGKERHIDTGKWPSAKVTLSPRVGFIYDVFGNKTLKVRGGTGLFSGRLPLVFFTNMPTNGGLVQYQAQLNAKTKIFDGKKNEWVKGFENYSGTYTSNSNGDRYLDMTLEFEGEENLPSKDDGKLYTFVSNHPLGGIDGVALGSIIGRKYDSRFRYLVNDLLMNLPGLAPLCIPINKTGSQSRNFPAMVETGFQSDYHMLMFPAGLCSRKINGEIRDLPWKKTFLSKSIEYKRDIVPIHFSGQNSNFFYRLANFSDRHIKKVNIAMLFLVDEMYKNVHKTFKVSFGKPIPWQTFDKSKSPMEWVKFVYDRVYEL